MLRTKKAAFTLIEVLIVVVILAVLAATIIPQFTDSTTDAKKSSALMNLHTLRSQIQLYRAQHEGRVPSATLNELKISTTVNGTANGPFGPYITKIPVNSINSLDTISTVTSAATASDADGATGWIYNTSTGDIWINDSTLWTE